LAASLVHVDVERTLQAREIVRYPGKMSDAFRKWRMFFALYRDAFAEGKDAERMEGDRG
jgi:hypothetical protein